MATELEWAWIAGIIEGEGSIKFRQYVDKRSKKNTNCALSVGQSDLELLEMLAAKTEAGMIYEVALASNPLAKKKHWVWNVGRQEDIKKILEKCYPWFTARRKTQADKVLSWINR